MNAEYVNTLNRVMMIPDYSPPAEMARVLCVMRNRIPSNYASVPGCGMLEEWRAVILETLLLDLIKGAL